ncbi:MAG: hypothetical protein J6S83_08660 [Lachnospiraceae bacterium]|nr:hypothetical protein [Lachnospiraceae bacterium]
MMKRTINSGMIRSCLVMLLFTVLLSVCAFGAGHNLTDAEQISLGKTIEGSSSSQNTWDYYKFVLARNAVVKIEMTAEGSGKPVYIRAHNARGDEVFQILTGDANNWGYDTGVLYVSLAKGINYVSCQPMWPRTANYKLTVTQVAGEDARTAVAGSETRYLKDAHPFSLGQNLYDTARQYGNNYTFTANSRQKIMLNVKVLDNLNKNEIYVRLLDGNGNKIDEVKNGRDTFLGYDTLGKGYTLVREIDPGTYFVQVTSLWNGYTASARYTIATASSVPLDIPAGLAAKNLAAGVEVSWKPVSGAEGYNIYRRKSGGSWEKIGSSGRDETVYLDKSAKNGIAYDYSVQAFNSMTTGSYSRTGTTILRLKRVSVTSCRRQKGRKLLVKWKKNRAASYYLVQYSTNADFTGAKKKKVKNALQVTLKGLKNNTRYYVRVCAGGKAGRKNYTGEYSKVKKVTVKK